MICVTSGYMSYMTRIAIRREVVEIYEVLNRLKINSNTIDIKIGKGEMLNVFENEYLKVIEIHHLKC